jgi:hypothetical protein
MDFSQLVFMLALILGGGPSGKHVGVAAAADARAVVHTDPGRDRSEDLVPVHRTLPRASEQEQLAAGLVFGVATTGRTR